MARAQRRPARWTPGRVAITVATLVALVAALAPLPATTPAARALPDRPIAIVGDSLGVGSAPYITAELNSLGITNRSSVVGGRRIPSYVAAPFSGVLAVREMRAAGFDPETWVVALGTNDVGVSGGQDPVTLRAIVDEMRAEINSTGPKRIWWVNVSRTDLPGPSATFNAVLRDIAAADPTFRVVDFAAWLDAGRQHLLASDGIHLTAAGYRSRARFILIDVLRDYGLRYVGGDPDLHQAFTASGSGVPLGYTPLVPARVLDTRVTGPRFEPGVVYSLDLSFVVSPAAEAISASLAIDGADSDGFLTAFPCAGVLPPTSSLNFTAGRAQSSHVLVGLGAGRQLCLRASTRTDVIIDLQGTFAPGPGAGLLASTPTRLVDTRESGRRPTIVLTAPPGASALVLNLAATDPDLPGFLSVHPCDRPPNVTASLNFRAGETISGAVFATVGGDGRVCVSSNTSTDVVVDLTATLTADGSGWRFLPATPTRVLDTRDATGGWVGRTGFGSTFELESAPAGALATSGLIAFVTPDAAGFGVLYPCGDIPGTANVNAPTGGIAANSFTVAGPGGHICTLTSTPGDVVVDTTGWWIG